MRFKWYDACGYYGFPLIGTLWLLNLFCYESHFILTHLTFKSFLATKHCSMHWCCWERNLWTCSEHPWRACSSQCWPSLQICPAPSSPWNNSSELNSDASTSGAFPSPLWSFHSTGFHDIAPSWFFANYSSFLLLFSLSSLDGLPPTSAWNIEIPRFGLGLWLNQSTSWIIFNHMCHFLHFSVLTNLYVGFKLSHTSEHTPYGFLDMSPAGVLNHCKCKIFKIELFLIMWTLSSLYILYFR